MGKRAVGGAGPWGTRLWRQSGLKETTFGLNCFKKISRCILRWRDTARKVCGTDSIGNFGLRRREEGCEGLFENNWSLFLLNLAFACFLTNCTFGGHRFGRYHHGLRIGWWWEGGEHRGGWLGGTPGHLQVLLLSRHPCWLFVFRAGVYLPRHKDGHIGHLFRRRKAGGRLWVWGELGGKNVLSIIASQVLAATYEQGVLVPVLSETFGPTFHYEELTSWDVERQPLMADPYECRWCQVTKFYLHQYGSHLHQHWFRFKDPNWSRVERGCFLRERWGITNNKDDNLLLVMMLIKM